MSLAFYNPVQKVSITVQSVQDFHMKGGDLSEESNSDHRFSSLRICHYLSVLCNRGEEGSPGSCTYGEEGSPGSGEKAPAKVKQVTGEVTAMDAKSITVKGKKGDVVIAVEEKMVAGIKAGDKVVVKYTEADGKNTAKSVKKAEAKPAEKKAEPAAKPAEKKAEPAAKPAEKK